MFGNSIVSGFYEPDYIEFASDYLDANYPNDRDAQGPVISLLRPQIEDEAAQDGREIITLIDGENIEEIEQQLTNITGETLLQNSFEASPVDQEQAAQTSQTQAAQSAIASIHKDIDPLVLWSGAALIGAALLIKITR